jgi:O-antigen ligase
VKGAQFAPVALVAATPLATWITTSLTAHPTVAGLVPASWERIGALVFAALSLWVAAQEALANRGLSAVYRAALGFGVAAIVASLLGFDPLSGTGGAILFAAIAFWGSALRRISISGGWRPLLIAFLCAGLVLCVAALAAMISRVPSELYAFAHGRAIGIFESPNELALFALAVCAVAGGAMFLEDSVRWLGAVALVVGVATLVATGSRSGEAAFAIGAIALGIALGARRGALAAFLLVAVVGVGLSLWVDQRHNPADNEIRVAAWHAGIRAVTLFPLTGVGVGSYYRVYPLVRSPDAPGPDDPIAFDPHDFYLSVAAETGLVGLAAFVWTIVAFAREARDALAGARAEARRFGLAVLAGLLAMGCHLIFNGFAIAIVLWSVLAALTLGLPRSGYGRVE